MGVVLKLFENSDKRYIKNRIDRFYKEFTSQQLDFEDLDTILLAVENYIIQCSDSDYKDQCIYRISEARFWLEEYKNEGN